MQERSPVTLSKKKQIIAGSEDFLRGFAALVPPLFVAGLLYDVPIENFQGHEKTAIYSLILLAGILKAAVENYKREHPSMAESYDYPTVVQGIDHFFATADGFASFVIPFLFLGIQDDLHPTVQLFHLPILIGSSVYSLISLVKSIDKASQLQSRALERQSLLNRPRPYIAEEGFVHDFRSLTDYLNNAIFPAFFLIAPLAFVLHDFFDTLTLPVMAGLGFAILLTAIARFYVYNYQRNHPNVIPKDYDFLVKIIELLSTTLGDFGLLAIPFLVLNAFFPFPEAVKIMGATAATTYSAIATVSKADDLKLLKTNTLTDEEENVSCWQSVKNVATNCCSFFSPAARLHQRYTRESLDPMDESNFHSSLSNNPLYYQENIQPENAGCWNTVKKAASSFSSLFSRSSSEGTASTESLLLARDRSSLDKKGYGAIYKVSINE